MAEQILLSSGSFDGVRETGGFGQPLHALYPQIRAVLASELGPEAADLLAEPVVDRAGNRIDWYISGDPDQPRVKLVDLPEEQRQPLLARVHDLLERGRELAERYLASGDARRTQLGAMLRAALSVPAEADLFLVEGRLVLIRWGFVPDRPWETPTNPARSPEVPPLESKPAESPRNLAIPEIAIPELATAAAEPETAGEPLETSPPPIPSTPSVSASLAPEPASDAPAKSALSALELESAPLASSPQSLAEPESTPESPSKHPSLLEGQTTPSAGATGSLPPRESSPTLPLRYVVVGSRYFWSVVALAVLLVIGAAVGFGTSQSLSHPLAGEAPWLTANADQERALTQAQRTEAELRTRLEQLREQLAARHAQCPSSDAGSSTAPTASATSAAREPGRSRTLPTQSTVAVATGENPYPPALTTPLINHAPAAAPETPVLPEGAKPVTVDSPPTRPPADVRSPSAAAPTTRTPSGTESPVLPEGAKPVIVDSPPTRPPADVRSPSAAAPTTRTPSGTESPTRTLEDLLAERPPAAAPTQSSPVPAPSPTPAESPVLAEPTAQVEPPVKSEPTAEERQEFTSRLSAAGAATGEITVTLLWNSPGDLDLVVRCPSGQQLDYRNPAACGGALDVDANTVRASLSYRPVENAFWPAGRAAPGGYEIAVRYIPRKDELNPQETPFQVRLIRGGQDSVFKGTVRPNALTPVTIFTVGR